MYFSLSKDLSYNATINILIGGRGIGKTYSVKKYALDRFLKTGEQFVYLRRYDTELLETSSVYFDDLLLKESKYDDYVIKYEGGNFLVNKEIAGYTIALNKHAHYKSASFPSVGTLIFEEFIIDPSLSAGSLQYLRNEVFLFQDICETIFRMRPAKIFMCGNAISQTCPYLTQWNLIFDKPVERFYSDGILIHNIPTPQEYIDAKDATPLGKIFRRSGYADYSVDNKYYADRTLKLGKKEPKSFCALTIRYHGKLFGVWTSKREYVISFSNIGPQKLVDLDAFELNPKSIRNMRGDVDLWAKKLKLMLCNDLITYESKAIYAELRLILSRLI